MKLRFLATVLCAALFLPAAAWAQGEGITGTVTDATNAVLPGVTVTALKIDNGNTFVEVTDGSGNYRLAVRPGIYKITADLTGFSPAVRDGLEIQVGQTSTVNLQLKLSSVSESVTVTGAAALVEVTQSKIGGNIDRRQVEELPVNGRNFVDLSMMAPGSKQNAVVESATPRNGIGGDSQINVDGQQVTQMTCCQDSFGNPRYSKDSIAEFEVVTTRFDASQGHSSGAQLNAITKSGTNRFAGSLGAYFRHDNMNAKDLVVGRVLPYQDQQVSGTFGGPIIQNKLHFFANWEGERTPATYVFSTPVPYLNTQSAKCPTCGDLSGPEKLYTSGVKFDWQMSPQAHAMFKGYRFHRDIPLLSAGGAVQTVSTANTAEKSSDSLFASLVQTFGSKAVNEVRAGYNSYFSLTLAYIDRDKFNGLQPPGSWQYPGAPRVNLPGLSYGGPANLPQRWLDTVYQVRDDLTLLYSKAGRHEVKVGGEYLHHNINLIWMQNTRGTLTVSAKPGGPVFKLADGTVAGGGSVDLDQVFPSQLDFTTWKLDALAPWTLRWQQAFGNNFIDGPNDIWSFWTQDNWSVNPRLTMNLGVRYEIAPNSLNEEAILTPFFPTQRALARDNFQPRLGANYNINGGKTSFRGGFGKYLAMNDARTQWGTDIAIITRIPSTTNDNRANFPSNPYNGAVPIALDAKGLPVTPGDLTSTVSAPNLRLNYSWQGSVGVQQQLGDTMSISADWVSQLGRDEWVSQNANLTWTQDLTPGAPAGQMVNNPTSTAALRALPAWGIIPMYESIGSSTYQGLQMAFNKRFSDHWQVSATYLLSKVQDWQPCGYATNTNGVSTFSIGQEITNCPGDIGNVTATAATDQRHRGTVNFIREFPYGIQLSGLYFWGSGQANAVTYGTDLRGLGAGQAGQLGILSGPLTPAQQALQPSCPVLYNNTGATAQCIAARNSQVGTPIHRVDLRFLKKISVSNTLKVDLLAEMFNVFNYDNFGSFTTTLSSANYNKPAQNTNVAYAPRILQLGFRVAF